MFVYASNGTHEYSPLQTLVDDNVEHMGLSRIPREHKVFTYSHLFLSMIEANTSVGKQVIYTKSIRKS